MTPPPALTPAVARMAGVGLVLVQCLTLGLLLEGYLFAIVMGTAALLSLWAPLRIEPRQAPHWAWFALLGMLVAVKHRLDPEVLNEQITFFHTTVGYEVSRVLVFVQVVWLFIRWPEGRMPVWFAGVACLSMVMGSNVRLTPQSRGAAQWLCAAFVVMLALFAAGNRRRATRRGDRLALIFAAAVLVLAVSVGTSASFFFRQFEEQLERWLAERGGADRTELVSPGFSDRGLLGDISNWKQHAAEHVALRVHAPAAPGYLRGMVFDTFRDAGWSETAHVRPAPMLTPDLPQPLRPGEKIYQLGAEEGTARQLPAFDVWPDTRTGERLFLPLGAQYLGAGESHISINRSDLVMRNGTGAPLPFTAWLDFQSVPAALDQLDRQRFLDIDDVQRPPLEQLAAELTRGCRTTPEKIRVIEQFFHQNFQYSLQRQWDRGPAVIVEFLTERPAAHCEYFASSGTLLLRAAGVPARYVTGYVAVEHNPEGNYWLARRKDAHAWIEAYDEADRHWLTVECTPPDGVPAVRTRDEWSDWWDARQQRLREMLHFASSGGVRGLALLAGRALLTVPGLTVLLLGSIAAVLWKRRQSRLHPERREEPHPRPQLQRELKSSDRLARRLGFVRSRNETLSTFADRLRSRPASGNSPTAELADWYDDYVRLRYGTAATASAEALAARLRRIARRRR